MAPISARAHDLDLREVPNEASGLLRMARRFYRLDHDARDLADAVAGAMGSDQASNADGCRPALAIMHAIVRERMRRGDTYSIGPKIETDIRKE